MMMFSTISSTKTVYNKAPIASFTYFPDFPIAGDTVTFNASSSYDPDGSIVSYFWDFGDGANTTTTDPVTTHVYASEGNYTVTLIVTDDDGANSDVSSLARIRNYPIAEFTYSPPSPAKDLPVTFNASLSEARGGYIVSYVWDFGDGNITETTDPIIVHVFYEAANYTVSLTVIDSEDLNSTKTLTIEVGIAPVPIFTYSPSLPYVWDVVTFNASSSYDPDGYIVSYVWDFGDGNITSTSDPIITHLFPAGGDYLVKLTVIDNKDCINETAAILTIEDYPTASFDWTPSSPIAEEPVTFNASLSSPNGGNITYYLWDFGDGTYANVTDPIIVHVYDQYGSYVVVLTVVDSFGLSDNASSTIIVRDYPTANFTWTPTYPEATESVTFNASSSEPNGGTIISYIWDFGDGTILTGNQPIVTHSYASSGNYSVTLTVYDDEDLSSSVTKIIVVLNAHPVASFDHSPEVPLKGETVTFNASSSYDPDGFIISYVWDFGDGTTSVSDNPIVYHTYQQEGNYTVTLTVIDNDDLNATVSGTIKIVTYPTASFDWTPQIPKSTEPVTFNASTSQANSGVITSYVWDFGDGNITETTDPIIIHVYSISGNYSVTLTVINSEGLSNNITKIVTVEPCPPNPKFTWSPSVPLKGETVTFDASASEPNGGTIIYYFWDFGDGNTAKGLNAKIVTHVYSNFGEYLVTLTVTDSEGASNLTSKIILIIAPPTANFTWSPQTPEVYETVTFNASSSMPNGGTITAYVWDFGDGTNVTTDDPIITHIYQQAGDYVVTLNVIDSEGLSNSTSRTLSVSGPSPPEAQFTYTPEPAYVYETITFNASTSLAGTGNITEYVWDFGDGNTTVTSEPITTYAYSQAGNFTVSLTVINTAGLSDTASTTITILPICGPTANFTISPTYPRPNKTITFDASSSLPGWNGTIHPPIESYVWDFGDGNVTSTSDPIITHIYTVEGNYTVTLVVIDINGLNDSMTQMIEVRATPPYDINGDGKIDIRDVAIVAYSYGSYPGHPRWNPDADITGPNEPDGKVDIRDVALVASHFGEILESTMFKPLKSPYSSFLLHVIILTILYSVALTAAQATLLIRKPIKAFSKYLLRKRVRNHASKTSITPLLP